MYIEYSFDTSFKKLFKKLEKTIPQYYQLRELEGIGEDLDLHEFSRKFFGKKGQATADVSVDANANVDTVSIVHYNNEIAKPLGRLYGMYLLWNYAKQLYNEEIAEEMVIKQFTKNIYINDFSNFAGIPYCFAFSLLDLMQQGIQFGGKIKAEPANHLSSFMGHVIAFLTYSCQQLSGACGMPDALVIISFFVDKLLNENRDVPKEFLIKQIKQELQGLIYQFNQPFRGALQSAFTNISIYDDYFLEKICSEYIFPDGSKPNKITINFLQETFLDLMNETLNKTPITFPIITACFSTDENHNVQDQAFLNLIAEKNCKYAFINMFAGKTSITSACCRLRVDSKNDFFNSFGSGSNKLGSLSVTTLNLPRLAYESKNKEEFLIKVKENVILASRINNIKRKMLEKNIEKGYLPLYTLGFMNLNKQYSTCGLNGLYEALEILGYDILKQEGQFLVKEMLIMINEINDKQSEKFKSPHNVEIVPAENASIKLAEADRILGYNKNYKFYSNQFIPLTKDVDMLDRIKLQGMFDSLLSGGSILHINTNDRITDVNFMKRLIEKAVNSGVIYHAVNYLLNRCKNNHFTVGNIEVCVNCGEKIIEKYERIVGFMVPHSQWNIKRREEDVPYRIRY